MNFEFFDKSTVIDALEEDGYFIHTETSTGARNEAKRLCELLTEYFNDLYDQENDEWNENKIYIFNREIPPSCNYGVITRSDKFPDLRLTEDSDEDLLKKEIESYKI